MSKEQEHRELTPAEKEEAAAIKAYRESTQLLDRIGLQAKTPPKEIKDKVPADMETVNGLVSTVEESLLQLRRLRGEKTNQQKMYFNARYVELYTLGINASGEWKRTLEGIERRRLWDNLRTSYANSFTSLQNISKHRRLNSRG